MADLIAGGVIPPEVRDAHMLKPPPHERLLMLDEELRAAATAGDTAKVRALRAEKKNLERAIEEKTSALLASAARPEISPPAKGEEARLNQRAAKIESDIAEKQRLRGKALAQLSDSPESESLLDRVDSLKTRIESLQAELQAIDSRREEIERWREGEDRRQALADKVRKWQRRLPECRRRLQTAVGKVLKSWEELAAGIAEFDSLRELLRNPQVPSDPLEETYRRVDLATRGEVTFNGSRWSITPGGQKK